MEEQNTASAYPQQWDTAAYPQQRDTAAGGYVELSGTVERILFQNPENGYTVLLLTPPDSDGETTVVGCFPGIAPGERMTVSGTWETHPRHGEQFRAVDSERHLPENPEEILRYLSAGTCRGIGPITARRIVDRFGADTFTVLEHDDAVRKLSALRGITRRKAGEIVTSFRQTMGLRRLMTFLAHCQLPPILAMRLRERFGEDALSTVRKNPYLLCGDSYGVDFALTDHIAAELGFASDCDERIQAAVVFELSFNERAGHVFLPADQLIAASAQLLECDPRLPERALERLWESGAVIRETVAGVEACYLRRLWEAETSARERLELFISTAPDRSAQADEIITEVEKALHVTYAPGQREAIRLAAQEGVVILTGGPGTGKTTTVRGITVLFDRMGLDTALCAPTGRAAQRLSELTGREAQTVHRMLGMSWDGVSQQVKFSRCEEDPLNVDAVIVDEMSMVDLPLFAALLRALRPGTRLVLVGDADQLPSVGPGHVFSDLIRSRRVSTVFLREIFRQAEQSAIIRNAHVVNAGHPPRLVNDQDDFFFLRRNDPDRAARTIVDLCVNRLPGRMGISAAQIQILSPTRKGPCGVEQLNRLLQDALNPHTRGKRELLWGDRLFREGDKIMQTRNDYDVLWRKPDGTMGAGIFNGDVGTITQIDSAGEWVRLDFEGRAAEYPVETLSEIDHAYAMTVHKAQGSEYRCVILAAGPMARSLMVRGVLYTALTRARELLIIVGDEGVIRSMATNDRQQRRYSGLRWRLAHGADHV